MKKITIFILSLSLLVSPMILFSVSDVFAASNFAPAGTGLPGGGDVTITKIVTNIMNWILGLVGVLGVIGFAIAGILYLTAAGDDNRIQTAKNAMMYSIIGVVVALVGLVAIQAIEAMLGGTKTDY